MKDNDFKKENAIKITSSESEKSKACESISLEQLRLEMERINNIGPMPLFSMSVISPAEACMVDDLLLYCYYDDSLPSPLPGVTRPLAKMDPFTKMVAILDRLPSVFSHTEFAQAGTSLGISTSTCKRLIKKAILLEYATKKVSMYFKTTKK